MKFFLYQNSKIFLETFNVQTLKDGRKIKQIGLRKNLDMPIKWTNGKYKYHWIYSYKFLDTNKFIDFEFNYFDIFVG